MEMVKIRKPMWKCTRCSFKTPDGEEASKHSKENPGHQMRMRIFRRKWDERRFWQTLDRIAKKEFKGGE